MATYETTQNYWKRLHRRTNYSKRNARNDRHDMMTKHILDTYGWVMGVCESFCELGMGSGRNINIFHERYPRVYYYGNDISEKTRKVVRDLYPDMLLYADIQIQDTLSYVRELKKKDIIFTYGHLMHLPDDIIGEVCREIGEKSQKYILLHEAYETEVKDRNYKKYRFSRDYSEIFGDRWVLTDGQIVEHHANKGIKYKIYLFVRKGLT